MWVYTRLTCFDAAGYATICSIVCSILESSVVKLSFSAVLLSIVCVFELGLVKTKVF